MSRFLALALCVALAASPAAGQSRNAPLKERVLLIPAGAFVEVKLKDKRKLRGRMGAADDDAFTVQYVKNDKVVDEKLAFQDVQSLKVKVSGNASTAANVVLGALAGAGAVFVVLLVIALALSD